MKNHFIFSYFGNKRNEVVNIYEKIDFEGVTHIVEPFCGSCAMSYYISLQHPKKYTYVLNDNDKYLIELIKLLKDKKKTKMFENKINKMCFNKDGLFINKEEYIKIVKENNIYSYFISKKYFTIRPGMYPMRDVMKKIKLDEITYPIISFLRNEKIIISCVDALDLYKKYENETTYLWLFDPPYLMSCNNYYDNIKNPESNIYEFFVDKKETQSKIMFILEENWITKLLFKSWISSTYDKIYQTNKRNTSHIIFKNF